jgi:hypothetical protein
MTIVLVFKDDAHFLFEGRLDKTLTVSVHVNIGLIKSLCETERRHICICLSSPLHQLLRGLEHVVNAASRELLFRITVDRRYREGSLRARVEFSPATGLVLRLATP